MSRQKSEEEKKRVLVQLRTTADDKKKLREYARNVGMNITDFVKARTIDKPPRTRVATYDREVLIQLLAELGKVGSNVNQIAKVMNEKNHYSVNVKETVITGTLESIRALSDQTLKLLQSDHTGENTGEWQPVGELPSENGGQ